jgi:hypothetical protein
VTVYRTDGLTRLISKLGQLGVDRGKLGLDVLDGLDSELVELLLGLIIGSRLGLSGALQSADQRVVLPANLRGEVTEAAELAARLQAKDAESVGDDLSLELVKRMRNTLEHLRKREERRRRTRVSTMSLRRTGERRRGEIDP